MGVLVGSSSAGSSQSWSPASILMANGFAEVHNLEGGYVAWTGAGLPVEHR